MPKIMLRSLPVVLFYFLTLCGTGAHAAEVYLNQLVQEYSGDPKFPQISTDPPGLGLRIEVIPRIQSEVVFQTSPEVARPSYQSYGIEGRVEKGLGDVVNLAGSNRQLESIEVEMVNWAKAASWPVLADENPAGYHHPVSIFVYRVQGESLFLLAQETEQIFIPWRPATLDDGGEYPFGGIAFTARFDFIEEVTLSGKIAVIVAYNTESSGFEPIGVDGPYNTLNVALANAPPSVGGDDDPSKMLRYVEGISRSSAFGSFSPMFTIRAFSANPSPGTPIDAGGYTVKATVDEPGFTGEATGNFQVAPKPVDLEVTGMRQPADGAPKSVSLVTMPPDLPFDVVFANRESPPVEMGLYPVFVTLKPGNHYGKSSGIMRLGYSYETWIEEKGVPLGQKGRGDDPDSDGVSNFQEYLAATDPGDFSEGLSNSLSLTRNGQDLLLGFTRNNEATDIDYVLESSGELGNEESWAELPIPPEGTNPFIDHEFVDVLFPLNSGSKRFFRLTATPN